ncbi:MAG: hypothetical protein LQ350_001152 [Teloschistes chrysophthalmus]|nr:MAG: hypothetical protein LQ350_001152 [Niorma chrysophthalma]
MPLQWFPTFGGQYDLTPSLQVAAATNVPVHDGLTNIAAGTKRPRSSTSASVASSRRTKSRASTTSNASSSHQQPIFHHRQPTDSAQGIPISTFPNHAFPYSPEEFIPQSQPHVATPDQGFMFDASLQQHPDHSENAYSHNQNTSLGHMQDNGQTGPTQPQLHPRHSYDERMNQALDHASGEHNVDDTGTTDGKKKKGSASSIANDLELRKLFRENMGRSLKEVAAQVLTNERGPRSEKNKQIFAMLWYNNPIVPPLNPASFGKLVRIIFPGIQTRRLGMRGESKYHYVDLALIDDQQAGRVGSVVQDSCAETRNARRSHLPASTAVFPSPDMPFHAAFDGDPKQGKARECLYLQKATGNMQKDPSRSNMVTYELEFSGMEDVFEHDDEAIVLPNIRNYVPLGTDADTAQALTALYRSHCISVIDAFRFCKERMLWHHFTSFHGTLTVPVQKLFAHASMATWITECDWLMYQKMVQFVSPLALQVIPVRVIDTFRAIATKLANHLTQTFQNHPQHVREAKLGPAAVFAGLLERLLRVNTTAHAAANILTNNANREQMWNDWVLHVKPYRVVESSLPGVGYQRTLRVLATEMRYLLGPLDTLTYGGMDPIYAETLNDPSPTSGRREDQENDHSTPAGVLDRWTEFFQTLPSLFPHADARTLIYSATAVGNAALRDITMAQALSFGSWCVTKTWVEEMLLWMAEKGGFIEHTPETMRMRERPETAQEMDFPADDASDMFEGSRPRTGISESVEMPSRFGSVDVSNNVARNQSRGASATFQENFLRRGSHPGSAPPPPPAARTSNDRLSRLSHHGQSLDDSGIGMEPEHDELDKDHYSNFVAEGTNLASDPADVVVC